MRPAEWREGWLAGEALAAEALAGEGLAGLAAEWLSGEYVPSMIVEAREAAVAPAADPSPWPPPLVPQWDPMCARLLVRAEEPPLLSLRSIGTLLSVACATNAPQMVRLHSGQLAAKPLCEIHERMHSPVTGAVVGGEPGLYWRGVFICGAWLVGVRAGCGYGAARGSRTSRVLYGG